MSGTDDDVRRAITDRAAQMRAVPAPFEQVVRQALARRARGESGVPSGAVPSITRDALTRRADSATPRLASFDTVLARAGVHPPPTPTPTPPTTQRATPSPSPSSPAAALGRTRADMRPHAVTSTPQQRRETTPRRPRLVLRAVLAATVVAGAAAAVYALSVGDTPTEQRATEPQATAAATTPTSETRPSDAAPVATVPGTVDTGSCVLAGTLVERPGSDQPAIPIEELGYAFDSPLPIESSASIDGGWLVITVSIDGALYEGFGLEGDLVDC
jgi:hypothetical protein